MEERVGEGQRGKKEKEIERRERHFCCHKKSRKYYRSALLTDKRTEETGNIIKFL